MPSRSGAAAAASIRPARPPALRSAVRAHAPAGRRGCPWAARSRSPRAPRRGRRGRVRAGGRGRDGHGNPPGSRPGPQAGLRPGRPKGSGQCLRVLRTASTVARSMIPRISVRVSAGSRIGVAGSDRGSAAGAGAPARLRQDTTIGAAGSDRAPRSGRRSGDAPARPAGSRRTPRPCRRSAAGTAASAAALRRAPPPPRGRGRRRSSRRCPRPPAREGGGGEAPPRRRRPRELQPATAAALYLRLPEKAGALADGGWQ